MLLADLLFLLLLLAAAAALLGAAWLAGTGHTAHALRVLRALLFGAAAYMSVVIVVSMILPREVVKPGGELCFDDWCIRIAAVRTRAGGARTFYDLDFTLRSRALRVTQREMNLAVRLASYSGRRYDPQADPSAAPFDVPLEPGESVTTRRTWALPAAEQPAGVEVTHPGGFPIGWFIVGYDTWFRDPALLKW